MWSLKYCSHPCKYKKIMYWWRLRTRHLLRSDTMTLYDLMSCTRFTHFCNLEEQSLERAWTLHVLSDQQQWQITGHITGSTGSGPWLVHCSLPLSLGKYAAIIRNVNIEQYRSKFKDYRNLIIVKIFIILIWFPQVDAGWREDQGDTEVTWQSWRKKTIYNMSIVQQIYYFFKKKKACYCIIVQRNTLSSTIYSLHNSISTSTSSSRCSSK